MPSPAASQTIRPSAMRDLFAAHHGWLLARLRARLPDTADAQDVAAETFLRLLAGRERGQAATEEIREPRALLTTIAKRLLYTLWHRRELERACLEVMAVDADRKLSHFRGLCRPKTEPGEQPTLLFFCAAEDEE